MIFSDQEVAYINAQRVARLATVSSDGQPDVVPVGYEFDGTDFYIAGLPMESTRKYRNMTAGNDKVALVIDDLAAVGPWPPRSLRVYGTAQVVTRDGRTGHGRYLKITPEVSWAWNLEGRPSGHPRSPGSSSPEGHGIARPQPEHHASADAWSNRRLVSSFKEVPTWRCNRMSFSCGAWTSSATRYVS